MQYLKKYFTEGLIQMAILLSLCGVRVDVGLPPSWHQMILGPTSALTQTQFHNHRNRLEDGHGLHPKSVDLDGFFTARRLLGWVHSLDRLQVPQSELETWLVQREPETVPLGYPDQRSPLVREPAGTERDQTSLVVDSRSAVGPLNEEEEEDDKEEEEHRVFGPSASMDESGDEEEEGGGPPGGSCVRAGRRERTQNEVDQTSLSFQECLRLLEETFPFAEDQEVHTGGVEDPELQTADRDPMLSPIIPTGDPSSNMELDWEDLLAIMESPDSDVDMMTSPDPTENPVAAETLQGDGSEALRNNSHNDYDQVTDPEVIPTESPLQHGPSGPPVRSELEPALFPLTPSEDLDDCNSASSTTELLKNSPVSSPPDHSDLLADDAPEDFSLVLNAEDNWSPFNINLLTQKVPDPLEDYPCSQNAPCPENLLKFEAQDLLPTSLSPPPAGNTVTQNPPTSPSSVFPLVEEDAEDEDDLPSPLGYLLEEAAILDEKRLLDFAVEEGFSPEMVNRLDEEFFLYRGESQQEDRSGSTAAAAEDQDQPRTREQNGPIEGDSDSGLSLDSSHSCASPCASEGSSSYSSSSSSCISTEESTFSEDEDAEEGLAGPDMEVNIKEELQEEELGAVGGGYTEDFEKLVPTNYRDEKLLKGSPWLEHISHDHTYEQPWRSASSPSVSKMPTRPSKSSLRQKKAKPYHSSSRRHISETRMRSRDERRARVLKVPFSNELIVDLPVDGFNDLLSTFQLSEEQLALVRDIRRRGKNKIAAQNCRKRKMDELQGLSEEVSGLRRYRSRLLREKQEALRNLQEMTRQLGNLYQDVFSRLRDEEGRPLDAMEYLLQFEPSGGVMVASRQQGAVMPPTKASKKQRDRKK